jgi:hypothetical protein
LPKTYRVVPEAAVVLTPTNPAVPKMDVTLAVAVLSDPDAKTFVVEMAFETNALPWTAKLARPGAVPIPTFEETTRVARFDTPVTFADTEKTFGVVSEVDTVVAPATVKDAFVTFVLIPT